MPREEKDTTGLYEALPKSLGGTNTRPMSASLTSLLPIPAPPTTEASHINASIRNRSLQLHAQETGADRGVAVCARRATGRKVVLPQAERKYRLYEPLHELWRHYAASMTTRGDGLLRMDLHGALVEVIKASDCGIVGVRGIVVAETANTVVVVTKRDRAIVIPKRVAVVQFMVGGDAVQLSLRGLAVRASERSAKKFKKKYVSL